MHLSRPRSVTGVSRPRAFPVGSATPIRMVPPVTPWVITREAQDGEPLVAALRARGQDALALPAIERRPLPWPASFDAPRGGIFFLTSPYAARLVLEHMRAPTGGLDDRGRRFAALSPSTAAAVREAGLPVDVTAEGGALALALALGTSKLDGTVLYPTSDAGLAQPEQEQAVVVLRERFDVVREAVYSTGPARDLDDRLDALPRGNAWRAVVFSPSAARALAAALARRKAPPPVIVAVGASTARALPFPSTLAPSHVDLVDFLCSFPDPSASSPSV